MPERIDAMFGGEQINITENRAVLHVACVRRERASIVVDGENVVPDVHAVLDRMAAFRRAVRSGEWTGHTGKRIRNIVNIGIGGSDLGPVMAYEALRHYSAARHDLPLRLERRRHRFRRGVARPRPGRDAVHRRSKTFTTLETMTNAHSRARLVPAGARRRARRYRQALCRRLDQRRGGRQVRHRHGNMFGFWDWVGGRYSMDSAIGLSTMLAIGPEHFRDMLAGFHAMDEHFRTAPFDQNLPVLHRPAHRLEQQLPRAPDGRRAALRSVPQALSGLPAAAHDGEQRQARHARRQHVDYDDRPDLLGRAGHQRPAFVLSAHPSGHAAGPVRLHRLRQSAESARATITTC